MRNALTDAESGLMRPGAFPHIDTATAAGNKTLLDSIEKAKPKGCREPDPIKNQEGTSHKSHDSWLRCQTYFFHKRDGDGF